MCGQPTARGSLFCSKACGQKGKRTDPEVEARRRERISARMKEVRKEIPNPMHRPEVREKVSQSLKRQGHKPPVQGGNSRNVPWPQMLLYSILKGRCGPQLWSLEYVESNGKGARAAGLPQHYKIDIACPERMIAIEVDGLSHGSLARRAQDERKTSVLRSRGWEVLRFSNYEVLEAPNMVADHVMAVWSSRSKSQPAATTPMES